MISRILLPEHFDRLVRLRESSLTVFLRARDRRDGQEVAVKVVKPLLWLNARDSAARRSSLLAALFGVSTATSDSLATIREIGEHVDSIFVARPFVAGESIAQLLARGRRFTRVETYEMTRAAAEALVALSSRGVTHGSLTAANILLQPDGRFIVTDPAFAAAARKLCVGSVPCRFAERKRPASDTAALAALVVEMSTGANPWLTGLDVRNAYDLPPRARQSLSIALGICRGGQPSPYELAESLKAAASRPALFPMVWRPAAAAGLFGALATVGGIAHSDKQSPLPVRPVSATVIPVPAPERAVPLPPTMPEEDRRTVGLAIRRQGAAALGNPMVADLFGLTDAQREEIAAILTDQRMKVIRLVDSAVQNGSGNAVSSSQVMSSLRRKTATAVICALNETQRGQWDDALRETRLAQSAGDTVL